AAPPEVPADLEVLRLLEGAEQVLREELTDLVTRHGLHPSPSRRAAGAARPGSASSRCPAGCPRARPPRRAPGRRSRRARGLSAASDPGSSIFTLSTVLRGCTHEVAERFSRRPVGLGR